MARAEARFFDGESAVAHEVDVMLSADSLVFSGPDVTQRSWPLAGLEAVSWLAPAEPLRLTHSSAPGTRLVIGDDAFRRELIRAAPQAGGAVNYRRIAGAAMIVIVALIAILGLSYATLTLAPQQFAILMPDSWRDRLGREIERSFAGGAKECKASQGIARLDRLEGRLREGNAGLPSFAIAVYDLPIVNAFALPGGRIIVSGKLIETATAPDQLAGVIAHELGHVAHRDPEAQLFRAAGLQVLLAFVTGGAGGDTLGGIAGTLAILRYSRDAERAADAYALDLLTNAQIDPMGLRHFLEAIREQEGKNPSGPFGKLTGILATHPLTEDRIKAINPLPPGIAREVLPVEDWTKLRSICTPQ